MKLNMNQSHCYHPEIDYRLCELCFVSITPQQYANEYLLKNDTPYSLTVCSCMYVACCGMSEVILWIHNNNDKQHLESLSIFSLLLSY